MTNKLSPSEDMHRRMAFLFNNDIEGWVDQYADDAVHEFPFSPPDRPTRIEGRSAIAQYMRRLPDMMSFENVHDLVVHETSDSKTVIAEFRLTGRVIATGSRFDRNYIWVITFREGKIAGFRDYMNPLSLPARDQSIASKT
jgi:ketosteroid isomerase-like protein